MFNGLKNSRIWQDARYKILLSSAAILILLGGLFVGLQLIKLPQDLRNRASQPTPVSGPANFVTIAPLDIPSVVYRFSVSGTVNLEGSNAFVRVILVDKNNNEYLVYETYSEIANGPSFTVSDACDETCVLDGVSPDHLRIEGNSAKFEIGSISSSSTLAESASQTKSTVSPESIKSVRLRVQNEKIAKLNEMIKKKGQRWVAGETAISKLSYVEKKKLFSKKEGGPVEVLPNLQGFEYYKTGIFEVTGLPPASEVTRSTISLAGTPTPTPVPSKITATPSATITPTPTAVTPTPTVSPSVKPTPTTTPTATATPTSSPTATIIPTPTATFTPTPTLPPPGPSNFVSSWDWRNRHGKNWISPVKNQIGCASCWAFGAISTTEAGINLYYNQPLNIDLSEQDTVCKHPGSCVNGGYFIDTFNELKTDGLVIEACYPYTGTEACPGRCADANNQLWKITNFTYINAYPLGDETVKQALITKGPIPFGILSWWHIMTLVGYENDAVTSQTIWILKNSWGTSWGENGFGRMIVPSYDRYSTAYIEHPFFAPNQNQYQIACTDNDRDGYCNWGIASVMPSSCSKTCQPQEDCDDSNPNMGPYDRSYKCKTIIRIPTPTKPPTTRSPTPTPTSRRTTPTL